MFLYSKKAFFLNSPAKILTCLRLDWSWGVIRSLTKKRKFLKTNFRTVFVVSQTHGKKLKSKFLLVVDYGSKLVNFICARTNAINLGIPYLTSLSLSSPTPKVCTDGQCTPANVLTKFAFINRFPFSLAMDSPLLARGRSATTGKSAQ